MHAVRGEIRGVACMYACVCANGKKERRKKKEKKIGRAKEVMPRRRSGEKARAMCIKE